jgi:membrane associated rhomboid family serine protease
VKRLRWPWLTLAVAAVTAMVIVLQTLLPGLIGAWQWDVARLREGEWWRVVTGVFVHTSGPLQIVFNLLGLLIIGWLVEQRWSHLAWACGAVAGVAAAEVAALWWHPVGGGISVALGGLVGLAVIGWLFDARLPPWFRFGVPVLYLAGATYVVALGDIHGPPVFAGALVGLLLLRQRRNIPLVTAHD